MTANVSATHVELLLVEDDDGDIFLTEEAFRETGMNLHINVVTDGEQALDYLHRRGPYAQATRPDLVLLDLNMPRKDGREVLEEIKQDPDLQQIPVAVLTTSDAEEDILQAYHLHANCYIRKPIDIKRFFEVMREIGNFWFCTVTLPPK